MQGEYVHCRTRSLSPIMCSFDCALLEAGLIIFSDNGLFRTHWLAESFSQDNSDGNRQGLSLCNGWKTGKGSFINDVTQILPKIDPPPSPLCHT